MFTAEEATEERIDSYLDALDQEKEQLTVALSQAKDADDAPRTKKLERRVKANAAEIERVEALKGGTPKKARRPRKPAAGKPEAATPPAGDAGDGKAAADA